MDRSRPIERLADALQACLNEAAERGADRAALKVREETGRSARRAAQEVKEELVPRLDRQDATLRLIRKQVKGSGRLPIDE